MKLFLKLIIVSGLMISGGVFNENVTLAAASAVNCDIQAGLCFGKTPSGISVEFDIQPKPVKAMSELAFIVVLKKGANPVSDASAAARIDLAMPGMYMGKNEVVLKNISNGRYEGKGIVTRCASGKKTWQADVTIGKEIVSFLFEVK